MNTTDPSAPTATVPCCGPRPICTVDGATPVSSLSMSLATTLTVTSCWPPWMSMSPSSSTATGGCSWSGGGAVPPQKSGSGEYPSPPAASSSTWYSTTRWVRRDGPALSNVVVQELATIGN